MSRPVELDAAPRCGAWSRRAQGPCRQVAMRGKCGCRFHGGKNPGPPLGSQNGLIHGKYSAAAIAERREAAAKARVVRAKVAEAVKAADDASRAAGKGKRRTRTNASADGGSPCPK